MADAIPSPPIQVIATRGELRLALDRDPRDPNVSAISRAIGFYLDAVESRQGGAAIHGREAAEAIASTRSPFAVVEISAQRASVIDEAHCLDGTATAHKPKHLLADAARASRHRNAEMGLGLTLEAERSKLSATRAEVADALSRAPATPVGKVLAATAKAIRQPRWERTPDGRFLHTGLDDVGRSGLRALHAHFGAGSFRAVIFDGDSMAAILARRPEREVFERVIADRAAEVERRRQASQTKAAAKAGHGIEIA